MIKWLKTFFWIFRDRCEFCGGRLNIYSDKKSWCLDCGKDN